MDGVIQRTTDGAALPQVPAAPQHPPAAVPVHGAVGVADPIGVDQDVDLVLAHGVHEMGVPAHGEQNPDGADQVHLIRVLRKSGLIPDCGCSPC